MLHEKTNRIAAFSTAKALEDLFCRRNSKRRCLLIMKGTETKVIRSPPFQFNEATNHFENIDAGKNLLYGWLCNQAVKYSLRGAYFTERKLRTLKLADYLKSSSLEISADVNNVRILVEKNLFFSSIKSFKFKYYPTPKGN
jgi:hypothetical protein